MLVREEISANSERVPGMSGENTLPEFNAEGIDVNLEHVDSIPENADANLGIATGSTIRYKILFGVLGTIGIILAIAALLKIIGGCYRVSRFYVDGELCNFFIEAGKNCLKLDAMLTNKIPDKDDVDKAYDGHGAAYKLCVTALYDIRNGIVIPFVKLKDNIAGLFKKEEVSSEVERGDGNYEEGDMYHPGHTNSQF